MKSRILAVLLLTLASAQAIILFRTGDPSENTTAPTGPGYADSGWQYEGLWGVVLGTPIAPHYFISAAHVQNAGNGFFIFQNVTYHVIDERYDPQSDLVIWKVEQTFPTFAPLYSRTDEVGLRTILFGRGTQRGSAIMLGNELKGWYWGDYDFQMRWGENIISAVVPLAPEDDLLAANFDENGLPNECHLSTFDSGGAAFIEDGTVWKLAGINYAVDGPYALDAQGDGAANASFFDATGFYFYNGNYFQPVPNPAPQPSALYPTRISTKLPWICATVAEASAGLEGGFSTLTYTRLKFPASDVVYSVQQSSDLVSWQTAATTEEVAPINDFAETVKSKVARPASGGLFLRLQISRPPPNRAARYMRPRNL